MLYNCLECEKDFDSERSLHAHIKKHGMFLHDYYVKYFQRRNLLTNEILPFKNKESYFERDFNNIHELYNWCEKTSGEIVKDYIHNKLATRIESRNLNFAPNEIELYTSFLPSIDIYRKHFISYNYLCEQLNIKPLFGEKLINHFWDKVIDGVDVYESLIITDTREQEPLFFKNQIVQKLDIGDYGIRDGFDYTFVDRKSEDDFKGTLSKDNLERFERELIRARSINCYIFVLIECDLYELENANKKAYHKSNLKYIYHNMRILQHKYNDCCQFVFTGSRSNSEKLIPLILRAGKKIWKTDMQYYINKNYGMGNRQSKK